MDIRTEKRKPEMAEAFRNGPPVSDRPLEGVRVVEYCSRISGPYCAKIMADLGAEVLKVDPPCVGDEARYMGPFAGDDPHPEKSGFFLYLNTNKRGLTLDPHKPEGKNIFLKLIKGADVLIEDRFRIGRGSRNMNHKYIRFSTDHGVGKIEIDRPESLNSLTIDVMRELDHTLKALEGDETIRVVVLTGAGDKSIVAGGDIKYMERVSASTLLNEQTEGQEIIRHLEELRKPVIARINGVALGGGAELALACDIRIASEKARFGLPEITLGIIPGYGGTQRLARLVGSGKAKELMMTGDIISAQEALRIGLVNRVVPHEQLDEEVDKLAKKLCERPPLGLQMVKETVNYGSQMDLNSGIRLEARVFNILFK